MAEVIVLPGVVRRDLGPEIDPVHVLVTAADAGLTKVIVVGYGPGGIGLWTSHPDMDANIGMLRRAEMELLRTTVDGEVDLGDAG